jgi:hypothetical protein
VLDERGRLFLAVKDTDYKLLTATAIPAGFLTDEMDRCRSRRQILILDCCHSGAFARGAKGDTRAITEATFQGSGYGRVVLTATDATQFALEGEQVIPEVQTSLFTHYLLQGLRTGEADRSPHDGKITLDEWYDYACERVVGQAPSQTPRKWSYNQQGELLIARNPHAEVRQAQLPPELLHALESRFAGVRLGAVEELGQLLRSSDASLARAARTALEGMCQDDSRAVSMAASQCLGDPAGREEAIEKRNAPTSDLIELSQEQTLMRSMSRRFWLKWVGAWFGASLAFSLAYESMGIPNLLALPPLDGTFTSKVYPYHLNKPRCKVGREQDNPQPVVYLH